MQIRDHCTKKAVLRIQIRIRIRMFLGLLDLDPLVRGMDLDPDHQAKIEKILLLCDFFLIFYL
jgi:hypothetical protein